MILAPEVAAALKATCEKLIADKVMLSKQQLEKYFGTFQERFGTQRLQNLDGQELLEVMHAHSNRDSLVYWLEFKDDEEFPNEFGSILGGSAFKFGLFRRAETGEWVAGSPQSPKTLSLNEAVTIARKHRDQLIAGAALLDSLPHNASIEDYRTLQNQIEQQAPDVCNLAWGHKYLYLLYPTKLDDFHSPAWQRFMLTKALQVVPKTDERYFFAWWFVQMCRELGMPMDWLTRCCNAYFGPFQPYWRIGTSDGNSPRNQWPVMRDGNFVAIGWPDLGDLSHLPVQTKVPESLREQLAAKYPSTPQAIGRTASQIHRFVTAMKPGQVVAASDGAAVLGIGKIDGSYQFSPGSDFPHRLPVRWLDLQEWQMPKPQGLLTTVYELTEPTILLEIERRLAAQKPPVDKPRHEPLLDGLAGRVQSILERKGQVILYGPPGTGKSYWAEQIAKELAALDSFGRSFAELDDADKATIHIRSKCTTPRVRICCFHPAYGYEDFIEGYRPIAVDGKVSFLLKSGIFRQLCDDARKETGRRFYLIIDEINRGDIPRIFGELLLLLEKSKRGLSVHLPLSGEPFQVPPNVFVIGTMNTADRSIAILDAALRRRFGFIELMPDSSLLGSTTAGSIPVRGWLESLNQRICKELGRDARNLQVGHSFLLDGEKPISDFRKFARVVQDEIIPLLEEYCYEDHEMLHRLLGGGLVDQINRRIRSELFEPANEQKLIAALLSGSPELQTSAAAISADLNPKVAEEDEDAIDGTSGETTA